MMSHDLREKILEKAMSLENYGLNDLAWNKKGSYPPNELIKV